jgi:hypothetical protein
MVERKNLKVNSQLLWKQASVQLFHTYNTLHKELDRKFNATNTTII